MNSIRESLQLARHIWSHPGNQENRIAGLGRFLAWQFRKRVFGKPIVISTIFGRRFKVETDSKFSSLVVYTKLPDWDEMKLLLHVLRKHDGFLDIGANVGFYTLLASARCDATNIWAAEALPRNVEVLTAQLALNALEAAHILPFALGEREGAVNFTMGDRETGTIATGSAEGTTIVPLRRLDDLIQPQQLPATTVAKIDVEGCEVEVLLGAGRLLSSGTIGLWLFEMSADNLAQRKQTAGGLLSLFRKHGYDFWEWDEGARSLKKVNPVASGRANLLAIHFEATWVRDRLLMVSSNANPLRPE